LAAKQERLDRLLSRLGYGSRSDVQVWLRRGLVSVCGKPAKSPAQKVDPEDVLLEDQPLDHPCGLTLIYHKPLGAVCSHREDGRLIYEDFPAHWTARRPSLSGVGRLDKETSGLLILTDDGHLNHHITSPKHHISRTYDVLLQASLRGDEADILASGTLLLKGDDRPCLPAELTVIDAHHASLVLHEGRYHQVRRMFAALGNHVCALCRTHIGALSLADTGLASGEYTVTTPERLLGLLSGDTCLPQRAQRELNTLDTD
jgi:16S rRNA pseudouridine516 synthase